VRFTDAELYAMPNDQLVRIEERMNARQFFKWTVFKMKALIAENTKSKHWFDNDNRFMMNYRLKSMTFYQIKLKKAKRK
jgi:hypothetical protein